MHRHHIPLIRPVGGISVGLVTENNEDGSMKSHKMLLDIIGSEDFYGDMDFKLCGTSEGVTGYLLYAREAPVQILDTTSWQPVDHADDVPADCTRFIPAPSIHPALVRASDGSVSLWDTAVHRAITQLDSGSDVDLFAVFSPDESLVAVCAHPWNPRGKDLTPVVIYRSDDGTKVRGLRSLHDSFQSLLWTSDGHYVLVASGNSGGKTTVSIFNGTSSHSESFSDIINSPLTNYSDFLFFECRQNILQLINYILELYDNYSIDQ